MPREVIEYRAVGVDRRSDNQPDYEHGGWCDREAAEKAAEHMRTAYSPDIAYDEVFLERRTVVYGEPERVKEGADGS